MFARPIALGHRRIVSPQIVGCVGRAYGAQTRERATPELPRASPSHPSPGRTCVEGDALNCLAPGYPFACVFLGQEVGPGFRVAPEVDGLRFSGARFPLRLPSPVPHRRLPRFGECSRASGRASGADGGAVERRSRGGAEGVDKTVTDEYSADISTVCFVPRNPAGTVGTRLCWPEWAETPKDAHG
jgi:hypothetical protein